jgi:hypothetical protein
MNDQRMMTGPAFLKIMAHRDPQFVPLGAGLTSRTMTSTLAFPSEVEETTTRTQEDRLLFRERLDLVRDVIGALVDEACPAQDQLMRTLVNTLYGEILRPTLRLKEWQLAAATTALSELDHETARVTPDVSLFCQRVRLVLDILTLA